MRLQNQNKIAVWGDYNSSKEKTKKHSYVALPGVTSSIFNITVAEKFHRDSFDTEIYIIRNNCQPEPELNYCNYVVIANEVYYKAISIKSDIKSLSERYEFIDSEKVEKFIEDNEYLIPILKEGIDEIKSVFGDEIKLCLNYIYDPEENWDTLMIVIKTNLSPEDAVRLESELSIKWFQRKNVDTKDKLNFIEKSI